MHYSELNNQRDLFIAGLYEPEENALEFIIAIGSESEKEEIISEDLDLGKGKRINYDQKSLKFKVRFETYTCYSVLNESFEQMNGGKFEGDKIRIYSESSFLDYSRTETFAEQIFQDELRHYSFITLNHIVNVISSNPPKISKF